MINWNDVMSREVPWQTCYAVVEREARDALSQTDLTIDTATLVEWLYPSSICNQDGVTARSRIFTALAALAKHSMQEYITIGELEKGAFGTMIRRKFWHAPRIKTKDPFYCPHCGTEIRDHDAGYERLT